MAFIERVTFLCKRSLAKSRSKLNKLELLHNNWRYEKAF